MIQEAVEIDWTLVGIALVAIIEVIYSLVPTATNWSILDNLYKLLRMVVPNRAQEGKRHKT